LHLGFNWFLSYILQLFTQQQQQHPNVAPSQSQQQSHQKPPPAYGAAISQIRSQHNQNKQQPQPQNVAMQHNLSLAPPTTAPASTTLANAGGKQPSKPHTEVFLNPPPPPPTQQQQAQIHGLVQHQQNQGQLHQHPHQQQQQQSQQMAASSSARMQQHHQQPPSLQSYGSGGSSSCSSSNTPSTSTSGLRVNRQTNSPFGALLNAAAAAACASPASSSASSVLRFAESPVAHYLERENGDFIVQETPKHIVECVEKEDGEFSVIERIYQSPPSVLHIHDDDEDEEDEEEEDDHDAPPEEEDGDDEREENSHSRNVGKTTKKARKTKPKRSSKRVSDEEFMSLSSGCESELERESKQEQPNAATALPPPLCTAPSTSTAGVYASSSNLADNHSNSASNSTSNSNSTTTKAKKNRITVLSDVPLNMNEYLDLMGNIVASSRIGAGRPFAAVAPIPLVKVEKEEPLDDYDSAGGATAGADPTDLEQKPSLEHGTTSVIRMASTAAATTTTATGLPAEDLTQPPPTLKVEVEPTTTLLPQRFSTPAQQRGPKKLVIKPKATAPATATTTKKTDTPSSSSSNPSISRDLVQVKSETLEAPAPSSSSSILEKHLTTTSRKLLHHHSAVNDDDARVLLEFANSKQPPPLAASSTTFVVNASTGGFPSAGSVFASSSSGCSKTPAKPGDEYILPDNNMEVDEIVISSSSSYTSSAAQVQATLQPPDFNFLYHQTTTTATTATYFNPFSRQQHHHQQQHHQQHGVSDATNAATLASSSSNSLDHDSMNATFRVAKTQSLHSWYQQEPEHDPQNPGGVESGTATPSNQSQDVVSHQPTNFNAALAAVDCCSVALDEDAKYLDLDACKREQLSSSSNLPSASASTTSSSFAGAGTESSLVGGLNIRTDEKMPAKGEISEQESNCDIENSWSESVSCILIVLYRKLV